MKSLKRKFDHIKANNQLWSDYVCLAEAIIGQKFAHRTIRDWFVKLIPKDDYESKECQELISWLVGISKLAPREPK